MVGFEGEKAANESNSKSSKEGLEADVTGVGSVAGEGRVSKDAKKSSLGEVSKADVGITGGIPMFGCELAGPSSPNASQDILIEISFSKQQRGQQK